MEPSKRNISKTVSGYPNVIMVDQKTATIPILEPEQLIKKFAPVLSFHPEEKFTPVTVEDYLENAMLISSATKTGVLATEKNLHMISLSSNKYYVEAKDSVSMSGNKSKAYVHAKSYDDTYTDLQYWFLFAQTGGASAHVKWLIDQTIKGYEGKINLDPIGRLGGHWGAIIVRVNNTTRDAEKVFFSQTGEGDWVEINKVQRVGSRVQVYVSRNNHSFYPSPGFCKGEKARFNSYSSELEFTIQNEIGEGKVIDFSESCELVSADYLGNDKPNEPFWLNSRHHWGNPNPDYLTIPSLKRMIPSTFGKSLDFLLSKELLDEMVNYLLFYFKEEFRCKTLGPKSWTYWSREEKNQPTQE